MSHDADYFHGWTNRIQGGDYFRGYLWGKIPKILPPIIILIDEQIEIAPNEKLTFVMDISRMPAAAELLKTPLDGAYLQVELITNFRLTLDAVVPGF